MNAREPRGVTRARVRMTRGGRKGAKATIRVAVYEARRAVDRVVSARLAAADRMSEAGNMPHVPSGKHRKKLADRALARLADK